MRCAYIKFIMTLKIKSKDTFEKLLLEIDCNAVRSISIIFLHSSLAVRRRAAFLFLINRQEIIFMGSDQRHNSLEMIAGECGRAEKMLFHYEHQERSWVSSRKS